jgi:hypothetical protein
MLTLMNRVHGEAAHMHCEILEACEKEAMGSALANLRLIAEALAADPDVRR